MRGHVIGEASNHTSGEMESHLKDPIEEDLTETLEKIHLSPGSPLPDFTQSMSDSSHARHYSHKLPTCVEQTQQVSGLSLVWAVLDGVSLKIN